MSKKKQKKDSEKEKFEYSNEIVGIIIVLMGIIGLGGYGPVGHFISSFSIFLFGSLYIIFLIGMLLWGGYLIIKRDKPNMFSLKFIGFYIILLSVLIFLHTEYVFKNNQSGINIITDTFSNLMLAFKSNLAIKESGGGIIGAIFSYAFCKCF